VWVHAAVADTRELRIDALRLVVPPATVLREMTAAWLYGADVRRDSDLDVHVYVPPGQRLRRRDGVVERETSLCADDVWRVGDVLVTSPTRTAFDCLRMRDETMAVVAADALTHLRRTTVDDLGAYVDRQRRVRNCRVAAGRLSLVEPLTESPMETRVRLLLRRAGLPMPQPQWVVRTAAGEFVARLDFAWPDARVALEYDGADHWSQRRHDDRRRAAARALGWHIDVISADDYWKTPDAVVEMVWRALSSRRTA
jgi:hypothetical protein